MFYNIRPSIHSRDAQLSMSCVTGRGLERLRQPIPQRRQVYEYTRGSQLLFITGCANVSYF